MIYIYIYDISPWHSEGRKRKHRPQFYKIRPNNKHFGSERIWQMKFQLPLYFVLVDSSRNLNTYLWTCDSECMTLQIINFLHC